MVFIALLLALGQLFWLWRCYIEGRGAVQKGTAKGARLMTPEPGFNAAMAGGFLLLLCILHLMLIPMGFGLIPRSQGMVFLCVMALAQGVLGIWLAGLAWLGELPRDLGIRWLWLSCILLCLVLLAASGLLTPVS